MIRGKTVKTVCACGEIFYPRVADVNRGWGKSCSKSCKAKTQTKRTGIYGPNYKADGKTVHQMASGNFAKSKLSSRRRNGSEPTGYITNIHYEEWDDDVIDGRVVWSKKHNSWIELHDENDPMQNSHPFDSDAAGFNNT